MADRYQVGTISAENTFTKILRVGLKARIAISLSGTWDATVTLQRQFYDINGNAGSWMDVESWSGNIETTYIVDRTSDIRLGIKTGNYTSGDAVLEFGFSG